MPRTLIAVGQFCATSSIASNLNACQSLIARASSAGAKVLFLPEASDFIATSPAESLSLLPQTPAFLSSIQAAAKAHSLDITLGIHSPSPEPGKLINESVYITSSGVLAHRYAKLHLFDISSSLVTLTESKTTTPGTAFTPPFPTPAGMLGLQICFDVRFPEGLRWLVNRGAEIVAYPSAFTVPTGRAHWEVLLRARAVEGQCWVVAAAQAGEHGKGRKSWGEAMVVDPWGVVRGRCKAGEEAGEEELCVVEVDTEMGEKVRGECLLRRRNDVYPEI